MTAPMSSGPGYASITVTETELRDPQVISVVGGRARARCRNALRRCYYGGVEHESWGARVPD